jgi:hypothetical protein
MMDPVEFAKVMYLLASLFPRMPSIKEKETIDAYYAILGDLPVELLKAAALEWGRRDTPWPPSAGQLRSLAFSLVERQQGQITAIEAWEEARRVLGDPSRYYPGIRGPSESDFSDPAVYDAVRAVGALDICHTPEEMMASTRARFLAAFDVFLDRRRASQQMLPAVRETMERLAGGDVARLRAGAQVARGVAGVGEVEFVVEDDADIR